MLRWIITCGIVACVALSLGLLMQQPTQEVVETASPSQTEALTAFDTVYEVCNHPRCVNCHALDRPLQGDESRPHLMNVKRGRGSEGVPGLLCSSCHNKLAVEGDGMPQGVFGDFWHMPPRRMHFIDVSKRTLAERFRNARFTGLDAEGMKDHAARDAILGHGWNPGTHRTPVPISREDFAKAMQTWVDGGMPLPPADAADESAQEGK